MGITRVELAHRTGIPASRITEIIKGRRAITAETALTLGIFFNVDAQFWINLQTQYDLRQMRLEKEAELRKRIDPLPLTAVAEDPLSYS